MSGAITGDLLRACTGCNSLQENISLKYKFKI
jgi:hypothetical protein